MLAIFLASCSFLATKISYINELANLCEKTGVDVKDIVGSERLGRVIEKDIKEFISLKINKKENIKINNEYEHSEFGKVEIKELPRIKRIAAPHLVNSWKNIPHVTNHDEADITEMEEFRSSLNDIYTG